MHRRRRALVHAAGHRRRTGSLTSFPVLPLSLADEGPWRRGWSTGHHRSLGDLGGTVDCRRVVDESCAPVSHPFACTTAYYILRHPRHILRLFRFSVPSSSWKLVPDMPPCSPHSTLLTRAYLSVDILSSLSLSFYPSPAYIIIPIYYISTPYTRFSLFSLGFSFSFLKRVTAYTSPICIFLLRGQPIIISCIFLWDLWIFFWCLYLAFLGILSFFLS